MVTVTITRCARCGERHEDVNVDPVPADEVGRDARFMCPVTGRLTRCRQDGGNSDG